MPPIAPKDIAGQQSKSFARGRPLVTGDADFGGDDRLVVADFVGALVEGDRIFRLFDRHADVPCEGKTEVAGLAPTDSGWIRILDMIAQLI